MQEITHAAQIGPFAQPPFSYSATKEITLGYVQYSVRWVEAPKPKGHWEWIPNEELEDSID
jgi:hypothetical protein